MKVVGDSGIEAEFIQAAVSQSLDDLSVHVSHRPLPVRSNDNKY